MKGGAALLVALAACGAPEAGGEADPDRPDAGRSDARPGSVVIGSYDYTVQGTDLRGAGFSASFYATVPDWPTAPEQGCAVLRYTQLEVPPSASAGVITVGTSPPIQLVPDATDAYPSVTTDGVPAANQSITVSASGDDVPAFSGAVTMPSGAVLTSPAPPRGDATVAVDRSVDLVVRWTGGSGDLRFEIGDASRSSTTTRVICAFAAASGIGTVPAAILSELPAGPGVIGASVSARTAVDAGEWMVDLVAATSVVWPDRSPASARATLQ